MQVLDRKLLRDLWRSKGQSAAVAAVILCGVASFITVLSAYRGLTRSRDRYYEAYRFADFWVPLERAPRRVAAEVAAVPGVLRAQCRIVQDVNLDVPGNDEPCTGRVVSLPERRGRTLNDVHLVSGRYFSGDVRNEVILSDRFAREHKLRIGDRVFATMNDRKQPLRIVGTALSPEFVYMVPNSRELLPRPNRFAILWLSEDFAEMALGMQEACNEVVGRLDPGVHPDPVLDRLEALLKPHGALAAVHRDDQPSHRILTDEINGQEVSAKITPTIFLGIAAMILMVLLDRLVHRERTAIGVLKAYGYSGVSIAAHYLKHALVLSLVGAALGYGTGQWLSVRMMALYREFFEFPMLRPRFHVDMLLGSIAISVVASATGASWAAWRVMRIQPAMAMRPASPRPGHRLLLERIGALWRNVGFIGKMILRDVFRYKVRSGLTVVGVMLSAAVLMLGNFTGDCMTYLMEYQFNIQQRQDIRVGLHTERGKDAFYDAARMPHVRVAEPLLEYPFTLRAGWREKDTVVTGVRPGDWMLGLRTTQGDAIDVGDAGLVLPDHVAKELRLGPGDTVILDPLLEKAGRETPVRVRAVVQQYLGTGAYMNLAALSRLLEEPFAVNAVLLRVEPGEQAALSRHLKDVPAAAAVEIKGESRKVFEDTMAQSMEISNIFLGLFAGVIAFAIIFNTTSISLTERTRELASLRVLGFTLGEIQRIVFGQNTLLAAAGLALGIPLGMLFCWLIVDAYATDVYRLPFYIARSTFAKTALQVGIYALLANLACRRRIARLDMVEALKRRE
jgi:putative ABC transport system permease protein